jgi:hypothetical protein
MSTTRARKTRIRFVATDDERGTVALLARADISHELICGTVRRKGKAIDRNTCSSISSAA